MIETVQVIDLIDPIETKERYRRQHDQSLPDLNWYCQRKHQLRCSADTHTQVHTHEQMPLYEHTHAHQTQHT